MARYQYQPLTGPVWRAPVAASLSWLPQGQAPARTVTAASLALYAASFFVAVFPTYDPSSLAWQPAGRQPARSAVQAPWTDRTTLGFPLYNSAELQWLPNGVLRVTPSRAIQTWTLLDPLPVAPAYNPAGLQWASYTTWPARTLPGAGPSGIVLSPFQIGAAAFDPAQFPYLTPPVLRGLQRGLLGDNVEPFVAALYRPEGLQWQPSDRVPSQVLAAIRAGNVVQEPLRNFDPQALQWVPRLVWPVRALVGVGSATVLNPFPLPTVLFDPAFLAWAPSGQPPSRILAAIRTGAFLLDPFPLPPPALPPPDLLRFRYDP